MSKRFLVLPAIVAFLSLSFFPTSTIEAKKKKGNSKIKVLVIDGQSINHKHWKEWTPVLLKQLQDAGFFQINVATSPMKGESLDKFNPKFKDYDVVISLYDGDNWSTRTQRNLEKYIMGGGGLVIVHAASNAFPSWDMYNEMLGLGGWGNRTETAGPYVYVDDQGETIRDNSPGPGGHHGPRHSFIVENRAEDHPIMKNIPEKWLHTEDELYDRLRGPANNMTILATSYSAAEYEGSLRNEPILMTIEHGEGHIFHTTMGHHKQALSCVGFMTTFIRGCQWAANKQVTFEIPDDFPNPNSTSKRNY
jgi:type 1 glutamine amidotransferase